MKINSFFGFLFLIKKVLSVLMNIHQACVREAIPKYDEMWKISKGSAKISKKVHSLKCRLYWDEEGRCSGFFPQIQMTEI